MFRTAVLLQKVYADDSVGVYYEVVPDHTEPNQVQQIAPPASPRAEPHATDTSNTLTQQTNSLVSLNNLVSTRFQDACASTHDQQVRFRFLTIYN
jgi:hypothetical protein